MLIICSLIIQLFLFNDGILKCSLTAQIEAEKKNPQTYIENRFFKPTFPYLAETAFNMNTAENKLSGKELNA